MKFDITTHCSPAKIKAAAILENILNEEVKDEKINLYVSRILNRFIRYIHSIDEVKDKKNWEFLLCLVYNEIKNHIIDRKFALNVETHLLNVISAMYREKLKFGKNERK
jgi:hypothetical protein